MAYVLCVLLSLLLLVVVGVGVGVGGGVGVVVVVVVVGNPCVVEGRRRAGPQPAASVQGHPGPRPLHGRGV